jgi:hypothetical protein
MLMRGSVARPDCRPLHGLPLEHLPEQFEVLPGPAGQLHLADRVKVRGPRRGDDGRYRVETFVMKCRGFQPAIFRIVWAAILAVAAVISTSAPEV